MLGRKNFKDYLISTIPEPKCIKTSFLRKIISERTNNAAAVDKIPRLSLS